MKIPKSIKIGGHWYEVKLPYVFQERFDRVDQADHEKLWIMVSEVDGNGSKRASSVIIETLIHEILHCLNYRSGDVIFDKDTYKMEDQISALSEAIIAFLVDNGYIDAI